MIKDEFPELFEVKLEVGRWHTYKKKGDAIYCITRIENKKIYAFGIDYLGYWNNECEWADAEFDSNRKLATLEEIESMLLKEAEKRGYKVGLEVKDAFVWSKTYTIRNGIFLHTEVDGKFSLIDYASDSGNYIFYDGKWAEIVVDPNKEIKESIQRLEEELAELKSKVK